MTKAEALATLTKAKHRITRTREAILSIMLTSHHRPLSAPDIFRELRGDVDLVTIYRNLDVFEAAGLVCRADVAHDVARFTLRHAGPHHHHVVCRVCGHVTPIDGCALRATERRLRDQGFSELEHTLEFRGTCPGCAG